MKTLFVLRHAKAQQDSPNGDFKRDLIDRGEQDAGKAGEHIVRLAKRVDLIVSSDATRALHTATIAAGKLKGQGEVVTDHGIYEAPAVRLLDIVKGLPDEASTVVLVGHNPGLEGLVDLLTSATTPETILKTAAFAQIELELDSWSDVDQGAGRLLGIHTP